MNIIPVYFKNIHFIFHYRALKDYQTLPLWNKSYHNSTLRYDRCECVNFWYTKQTTIVAEPNKLGTLFFQIVKVERFVCMYNTNDSFKVFRFCKCLSL